jgi:hypothetical protein
MKSWLAGLVLISIASMALADIGTTNRKFEGGYMVSIHGSLGASAETLIYFPPGYLRF